MCTVRINLPIRLKKNTNYFGSERDMPRKRQGWITFQTSDLERQQLEQFCEVTQRTKTDVLRELLRNLSLAMDEHTCLPESAG